jgi:hypothetical protein
MKRILSHSLVLSIFLLLSLPAVAGAGIFGRSDQLSGKYINSADIDRSNPPIAYEFSREKFTLNTMIGILQGTYSITDDKIVFVLSGGKTESYKFNRTKNTITLDSTIYVLSSAIEEGRKEIKEARKATINEMLKGTGFIAMSDSPMNWMDAKNYCEQESGELPLINDSESWATKLGVSFSSNDIDGFGATGAPWPLGLPDSRYWTGTVDSARSSYSWLVYKDGGSVVVHSADKSNRLNVLCVPPQAPADRARKGEARKAKEASRREEILKAGGFIAMSDSPMNWMNAKNYCEQQGGILPFIGDSDFRAFADRDKHLNVPTHIDGFGATGDLWPSKLPIQNYWTSTEIDAQDQAWGVYYGVDGRITIHHTKQSESLGVFCVPLRTPAHSPRKEQERKAEEARRMEEERRAELERRREEEVRMKEEEARMKKDERWAQIEEATKAAGFISVSKSRLNWQDAVAFCEQQSGRLPRINDSESWDGSGMGRAKIDGFSSSGMPNTSYWTGTVAKTGSGREAVWIVSKAKSGRVDFSTGDPSKTTAGVVCIPK